MDIQAPPHSVYLGVVAAFRGVTVALAGFAGVIHVPGCRPPGFLYKAWATRLTMLATRIVLALTDELVRVV